MQDADIHQHIESLGAEEHRLLEQGDLLRQRRARRDAGQSPEDTGMRPAKIVEHYQQ